MVHQPDPPESAELDLKLQTFYGKLVIPAELFRLFNGLRGWHCIPAQEHSHASLVATFWQWLQKQVGVLGHLHISFEPGFGVALGLVLTNLLARQKNSCRPIVELKNQFFAML